MDFGCIEFLPDIFRQQLQRVLRAVPVAPLIPVGGVHPRADQPVPQVRIWTQDRTDYFNSRTSPLDKRISQY